MSIDIQTVGFCSSYFAVYDVQSDSNSAQFYAVTLHGTSSAHCTCEAFRWARGDNCKHIERVWREACLWNPQWRDRDPLDPPVVQWPVEYLPEVPFLGQCPSCGGPLTAVKIAV